MTDAALSELLPSTPLHRWLTLAVDRVAFQGLPARICRPRPASATAPGLRFNELVRSGAVCAPSSSAATISTPGAWPPPTGKPSDARRHDAIADWPILNALLNTASGATWVAVHHGGGVGIGRSIHAGAQVVCDGRSSPIGPRARSLRNDPATGVMRHADAGYEAARVAARERHVRIPMLGTS